MSQHKYQTFKDFYPFYLSEHSQPINRRLHFLGTAVVIVIILAVLTGLSPWALIFVPIAGYGFAWIGHFFIEKNRPATFKYPFYSLLADFVMFKDILIGKIKF